MPNAQPASPFITLFPGEEMAGILQNIHALLPSLSRPTTGCARPEEALSRQLFLKLSALPEYRTGPVEPHLESWLVCNTGTSPTISGRGDIRFSCGRGVETYFLVEAKRLFVTFPGGKKANLVVDYVDDGMMRFITGQYASTQGAGAMLGYVFDADLATVKTTLSKQIAASSAKLCLSGSWQPSTLPVDPPVNEIRHTLIGRGLVIYHLLAKI